MYCFHGHASDLEKILELDLPVYNNWINKLINLSDFREKCIFPPQPLTQICRAPKNSTSTTLRR